MSKYKKRSDGRYASQILIGYTDDGKRKIKTLYGKTILELDKKVAEFRSLFEQGILLDANNYTLLSWSEKWFKIYGTKGLKSTSLRSKESDLKHITSSGIANIPIDKIRTRHLQQIINDVFDKSPSKAQKVYSMLVNIFDGAIKNNLVIKNVAKDVEVPKYSVKEKRTLSSKEQNVFRNADFDLQKRVFISLALDCGLRKGEILALSLNDFDIKNEIVDIHKTYDITKRIILPTPKSESGNRKVPVSKKTIEYAQKLAVENDSIQLFLHNGKPFSGGDFNKMWNSIINKVIENLGGREVNAGGIKTGDITPHFLRHTYATNLFYAGVDIKAAQYLLGHASIETTLKIYTHLQLNNEEIKTRLYNYINQMEVSHKSVKNL